jgi:magnesium-transporting ATPase (P-type)
MRKKVNTYLKTLLSKEVQIQYEQPSDLLYIFQGHLADKETKSQLKQTMSKQQVIRSLRRMPQDAPFFEMNENPETHLSSENLLLRGSVLRNTEMVYGVVLYTGHDTKIMMNSVNAQPKRSKLENQLNR